MDISLGLQRAQRWLNSSWDLGGSLRRPPGNPERQMGDRVVFLAWSQLSQGQGWRGTRGSLGEPDEAGGTREDLCLLTSPRSL